MIIWRIRIACRVPKATSRISEYVRYLFYTVTTFAQTRLKIRLHYIDCLVMNETTLSAHLSVRLMSV